MPDYDEVPIGCLSTVLERDLTETLGGEAFRAAWAQLGITPETPWGDRWRMAKGIIERDGLLDLSRVVFSSDVWQRLMLEQGLMA